MARRPLGLLVSAPILSPFPRAPGGAPPGVRASAPHISGFLEFTGWGWPMRETLGGSVCFNGKDGGTESARSGLESQPGSPGRLLPASSVPGARDSPQAPCISCSSTRRVRIQRTRFRVYEPAPADQPLIDCRHGMLPAFEGKGKCTGTTETESGIIKAMK